MTKLYVQLGRAGDILSILPLLHKDFKTTGEKPGLMVAAEFAPLLDGVSYVERIVHDGPHYEIAKAVEAAKKICPTVICTQVNGPIAQVREFTYKPAGQERAKAPNFQREQWGVAGRAAEWHDCLPLVIDQRDSAREQALLENHGLLKKQKKPLLLLALQSTSSPFPYSDLLRIAVENKFGDTHRILELPQAERLYDLLAIYEKAALLIAVDSAPLHLVWAVPHLPVFALTQDKPLLWNGAAWRPNHLWYCRYHDWPDRAMEMLDAIASVQKPRALNPYLTVWSAYDDPTHYAVHPSMLPVPIGACSRDSANALKDQKRFPYLRDVLHLALQRATDSQQIILTKSRINISSFSSIASPFYAYRMTKNGDDRDFSPICDLFCATKSWWQSVMSEIPDLVMNDDFFWGQCLWALFKSKGANDATGVCSYLKEAA